MKEALALLLLILWPVSAAPQSPSTQAALNYLRANHERHLDKQVQIAEVAAPTFHEGERAKLMAEEFRPSAG